MVLYLYRMSFSAVNLNEILTVSFTLFAVIDMLGSIPILASLREKIGGVIKSTPALQHLSEAHVEE
jgi:small neutral amino acid transporter SnatA (MarC family)